MKQIKPLLILMIMCLPLLLSAQRIDSFSTLNYFLQLKPAQVDSLQAQNLFGQKEHLINQYNFNEHKALQEISIELNKTSLIKKYKKLLTKGFGSPLQENNKTIYWIKDGLKYSFLESDKKAFIKINPVRFYDYGKLDMPKDVFVLDYKKAGVYGNNKIQDVYLLGTKSSWDSPFWSSVWIYADEGAGANEMIYMFQEPHNSAYEPRLDFVNLLDKEIPQIIISSPTGGSGGIVNMIIFSAKDALPFVHYDSERATNLLFTGKLLDNYQAEISFKDSTSVNLNLKNRKKMYKEYKIYENDKLVAPVEVWGTQIVGFEISAPDKNGLQLITFLQEARGFANIDRFALIKSEMALDVNNKWALIKRNIVKY